MLFYHKSPSTIPFPSSDKEAAEDVENKNEETLTDNEEEQTEQKEIVEESPKVLSEKCEVCEKTLSRDETWMEHLVINHLDRYNVVG